MAELTPEEQRLRQAADRLRALLAKREAERDMERANADYWLDQFLAIADRYCGPLPEPKRNRSDRLPDEAPAVRAMSAENERLELESSNAKFAAAAIESRAEHLEAMLAKVREDLLDRAKIAAERKDASGDKREREFYSGQASAFEMAALLIPLSGEAA